MVVAGAYWREDIIENELRAWQAEISATCDPKEEELRRFLNTLATALDALTGMQ